MWDTLRERFVEETGSAGRCAVARAVVAYCDGKQVRTFIGERPGTIAPEPRGDRHFYWDTVFIPDDPSGRSQGKTYAEIVGSPDLGLSYKIRELSQSSLALKSFLEYRLLTGDPELWR
jgi:XTP/dITP diphosphohydrolase